MRGDIAKVRRLQWSIKENVLKSRVSRDVFFFLRREIETRQRRLRQSPGLQSPAEAEENPGPWAPTASPGPRAALPVNTRRLMRVESG